MITGSELITWSGTADARSAFEERASEPDQFIAQWINMP
jgi:hypothetical protein